MGEYDRNNPRDAKGGTAGQGAQADQSQSGSGQQGGFNDAQGQQSQFDSGSNDWSGQIRKHMEVIGADGTHVGTVDGIDGHRIKLTKSDNDAGHEGGSHSGHHHYLSAGLVAGVEGDKVRLSANGDVAWGMLEEK